MPLGEFPFGAPLPERSDPAPGSPVDQLVDPTVPGAGSTVGDTRQDAPPQAVPAASEAVAPPEDPAVQIAGAAATWGIPGSSWAELADEPAHAAPDDPAVPESAQPVTGDPATPAPYGRRARRDPEDEPSEQAPIQPADPVGPPNAQSPGEPPNNQPSNDTSNEVPSPAASFPSYTVNGLFGERLTIGLTTLVDPADDLLRTAGYRLDADERAVLVQTTLRNDSPIDYEALPDLYLELVHLDPATGQPRGLGKASLTVPGHPTHRVGLPAGQQTAGWTLFLLPQRLAVTAIQWSVRPDLADRTVRWELNQ